ncbi:MULTISPECIES: hypothetical protein [unclassified Leeuwenhoekiella]|uniref:hypothetical protein n=1 Tax=unclassified Leeuwenhoekiella TaxID=2615029 RepID=UPI000C3BD041|nr:MULTISPECIES: hypothetical protein [unclassified Leeuwenhoekiella]MAW95221.1 hypothetical protein [Leeuwenhoekiella sp.]MBA81856.1 hypothetical protein [Leeuwenhoekiella sp.]|tara:strand:- start:10619 stop:11128 length:510 start_codon:yes stop_codon:yes gene_type:complete
MTVTFGDLVQLISVIIWPLTLLIIVFKFKTFFGGAINRMQSLDASASGISMTFQNKIDEAKALLSKMAPQIRAQSKSASGAVQGSPYERILNIKKELQKFIIDKAEACKIQTNGQDPASLTTQLAEIGALTFQQQQSITTTLDLVNSADHSVTDSQVVVVDQLYQSIRN